MDDVFGTGLPVKAVEDRLVVSDVMDRREFRRVEKMTRADSVQHDEISDLRSAEAERRAAAPRSKGSPVGGTSPNALVAPSPERVVAFTTRLDLSPYCASGAPRDQLHRLDRVRRYHR